MTANPQNFNDVIACWHSTRMNIFVRQQKLIAHMMAIVTDCISTGGNASPPSVCPSIWNISPSVSNLTFQPPTLTCARVWVITTALMGQKVKVRVRVSVQNVVGGNLIINRRQFSGTHKPRLKLAFRCQLSSSTSELLRATRPEWLSACCSSPSRTTWCSGRHSQTRLTGMPAQPEIQWEAYCY